MSPIVALLRRAALLLAPVLAALGCASSVAPEPDARADGRSAVDAFVAPDSADASIDPSLVGTLPVSCGSFGGDGSAPVDCTGNGDVDAICVFGDHCGCSERFRCTEPFSPDQANCAGRLCECARGARCVAR